MCGKYESINYMIVTQSSPGERSGKFSQNGKFDQNGKFSQNGTSRQKGKVHLGPNVSTFAHDRGCIVNGSGAMAAILLLLMWFLYFACDSLILRE